MTLIVAVKAPDGVVLASDSAATFSEGVKYPTTKIHQAGNRLVWGAAGHELGERHRQYGSDNIGRHGSD
jgi:20S proteasome alpha/beta subunit